LAYKAATIANEASNCVTTHYLCILNTDLSEFSTGSDAPEQPDLGSGTKVEAQIGDLVTIAVKPTSQIRDVQARFGSQV